MTTVSKKIKRNQVEKKKGVPRYPNNAYIHGKNCKKKNICLQERYDIEDGLNKC